MQNFTFYLYIIIINKEPLTLCYYHTIYIKKMRSFYWDVPGRTRAITCSNVCNLYMCGWEPCTIHTHHSSRSNFHISLYLYIFLMITYCLKWFMIESNLLLKSHYIFFLQITCEILNTQKKQTITITYNIFKRLT